VSWGSAAVAHGGSRANHPRPKPHEHTPPRASAFPISTGREVCLMSAYDAISSRITGLTLRPRSALRMGTLCLPSPAKSLLASRFCRDWREGPGGGSGTCPAVPPRLHEEWARGEPGPRPRRSHPLWGSHYMRRSKSPVFTRGPSSNHLRAPTCKLRPHCPTWPLACSAPRYFGPRHRQDALQLKKRNG
jgi:hypothetical protein